MILLGWGAGLGRRNDLSKAEADRIREIAYYQSYRAEYT